MISPLWAVVLLLDRALRVQAHGRACSLASLAQAMRWPGQGHNNIQRRIKEHARQLPFLLRPGASMPWVVVVDGRIIVDGEDCTPTVDGEAYLLLSRNRRGGCCVVCGSHVEAGAGWVMRRISPPAHPGAVACCGCCGGSDRFLALEIGGEP